MHVASCLCVCVSGKFLIIAISLRVCISKLYVLKLLCQIIACGRDRAVAVAVAVDSHRVPIHLKTFGTRV